MAQVNSSGKVLYVDPNPEGTDIINHEDLSIFVELVTTKKSRAEINVDSVEKTVNLQTGGDKIPIKFLKGSSTGDDGRTQLTTHYTEINTNFNEANPDLETLGITSIDIDFNTAYAPMVKINFTDIRGQLFEMGNESPYNVFFNLPYPIFELTVKGYYGKAVKYCLHLTKFSGKLNDKTGNFEIQCDFIGYTYAFLADILMGYLRGMVETDMAKDKISQAKIDFAQKGETFLPFNELNEKVKSLNKELIKLKQDDESVKELAAAEDMLIDVAKMKEIIRKFLVKITRQTNPNDNKTIEIYNNNRFALIRQSEDEDHKTFLTNSIQSHNENIDDKVKLLNETLGTGKYNIDINSLKLTSGENWSTGIRKVDFLTNEPYEGGEDSYLSQGDTISGGTPDLKTRPIVTSRDTDDDDEESGEDYYNDLRRIFRTVTGVDNNADMVMFDLRPMFVYLDKILADIKADVKKTKEALSDDLINQIKEIFGFDPTIGNMVHILTEHVHILMRCLKLKAQEISEDMANGARETQLTNLVVDKEYDVASETDPECGDGVISTPSDTDLNGVLPWPDYKEKSTDDGTFEDKWVGNKAPTMPEVDFIEQLLEGLITAKRKDNELLDELEFGEDEWYPINPFDTKFMTGYENPWKAFKDANEPAEIIRHMLIRATIFLGYSYKTLDDEEIKVMGKLEANNAFNAIENEWLRKTLAFNTAEEILQTAGAVDGEGDEEIRAQWGNSATFFHDNKIFRRHQYEESNILGFVADSAIFYLKIIAVPFTGGLSLLLPGDVPDTNDIVEVKTLTQYNYIGVLEGVVPSESNNFSSGIKYYLPLSSADSDPTFFEGDSIMSKDGEILTSGDTYEFATDEDRIALRDAGNIFFGSYMGGNTRGGVDKPDDGSTTIDFITTKRYDSLPNQYPVYVEGLLDNLPANGNENIAGSAAVDMSDYDSIPEDGMKTFNNLFGGRWKTHEFRNVVVEQEYENFGKNLESWIYFYQDTTAARPIFTGVRSQDKFSLASTATLADITLDEDGSGTIVPTAGAGGAFMIPAASIGQQKTIQAARADSNNGKTIVNLLQYKQGIDQDSVAIPFFNFEMYSKESSIIDFDIGIGSALEDILSMQYSVFGSDLYYSQEELASRAYLFLHSIPWNGLVFNFTDGFFGTWGNSNENALNFYDTCGDSEEEVDEGNQCNRGGGLFTHMIQHFFNQRAGFIEAPTPWIYMVGAILWRYRAATDPIIWEKNGYSLIPQQKVGEAIPAQSDYCLPNVARNEVFGFYNGDASDKGVLSKLVEIQTGGVSELIPVSEDYVDVERTLNRLPDAVANKFIDRFLSWVNAENGFNKIRGQYELFTDDATEDDRINLWLDWHHKMITDPNGYIGPVDDRDAAVAGKIRPNVAQNYIVASRDDKYTSINGTFSDPRENQAFRALESLRTGLSLFSATTMPIQQLLLTPSIPASTARANIAKAGVAAVQYGTPFNYFLEMRDAIDTRHAQHSLYEFFSSTEIIVNSSWRLWAANAENPNAIEASHPFRFDPDKMSTYVKSFVTEYARLNKENEEMMSDEEEQIKRELFNTIDAEDIKLNLYKNIKSIYDKWVPGSACEIDLCGSGSGGGECPDLFDTFRFMDRAYNDIANDFYINPIDMVLNMIEDYNISLYDYFGRTLADNNFDFIPLPTFIDYNDPNEIRAAFEPEPFNSSTVASGPQFICMYIGERSKHLNLGSQSQHKDDGFSIDPSKNCLPTDFISGSTFVPAFRVAYGDHNQSMFKNFKLDQSEFTETDESLQIIDELGTANDPSSMGQNLFNVYRTRSYSAQIESMGNAQIQPFMYFELDNVPMFSGAYTLINVKHTIKANSMSTRFKGVRVRKSRTKMVEKSTVFMSLIGTLSDIDYDGVDLDGLANAEGGSGGSGSAGGRQHLTADELKTLKGAPGWAGCITYHLKPNEGLIVQSQTKLNKGKITPFSIIEVGKFVERIGQKWNIYAVAEESEGNIFSPALYWNDLSLYGGGDHPDHASHEQGRDFDFRMIRNDKENGTITFNSPKYNQAETINLIKMILDTAIGWAKNNKDIWAWKETLEENGVVIHKKGDIVQMVEQIWYNDPDVISEFASYKGYSNIVKFSTDHDNHIHLRLRMPPRILEDASTGFQNCAERLPEPPPTGALEKIEDIPSNKENYVGKI